MGQRPTETQTAHETASEGSAPVEPHLYLALQTDHLLAAPARFALGGLDEVTVGRDAEPGSARTVEGGRRVLRVRLDQAIMSSRHARLEQVQGRWYVEDGGSKNGSLVNGTPVQRQLLADGDVVELGGAFFIFRQAVARSQDEPQESAGLATLIPPLAQAYGRLAAVARSPVSVVLHGEVGTGKEVLARAVHRLSARPGQFVSVNCGALPETLIETELFGYRKGAFSGAGEDRPGLIRAADHGTLFLDEIAELPMSSQVAFLRVLQEREVIPVGGTRAVPVDLRLVAASHGDLQELVDTGDFRADLLTRLQGFTFELPALRDRREDLGLLVASLLQRVAPDARQVAMRAKAARCLFAYDWPGNIRELEKCLGTAVVLAQGGPIAFDHLPAAVQGLSGARLPGRPRGDVLQEQLAALLTEHGGNVSAVARAMGKAPMQIRRWMKKFALDADSFRR